MKAPKWVRELIHTLRQAKAGKRVVAGLLAVVMLLGMVNFVIPAAEAEDTYAEEKEARQTEYEKKFDLKNLKWNENGKDANGKDVNHGISARPYLYWQDGSFGGVNYRNYIHVYAFEGDTICFGSDVYNSRLNKNGDAIRTNNEEKEDEKLLGEGSTVDIVLVDLQGNRILYDVKQDGIGHIPNIQTEVLAKTMESPSGNEKTVVATNTTYKYTPLTYKVQETGVYTLEFHSYDKGGNYGQTTKNDTVNRNNLNVADDFYGPYSTDNNATFHYPKDDDHGALVAAWDVSVFNEQGHKETGRVYVDYLSLQQNGGYDIHETYYAVTTDSYIYQWDWNGNRPNTYNFFADNQGLTDNATGNSLYKSVKELTNTGFDYTRFGASFKYPGSANTDQSKSFYIFFEMPNPDLEGHLYSKAIQPDPAYNIRFIDKVKLSDGEEVPGAYVGLGGYFAFDTKEATTASLVLNFNKLKNDKGEIITDGSGKNFASVTISGPVKPYSTNYFYWDGKDGNGKIIPAGTYNIQDILTLTTKAGEIHFPIHDMESSTGGFTFTRVSPIYDRKGNNVSGGILDATKSVIYYDDSALYYGEHVGKTGLSENNIRTSDNKSLLWNDSSRVVEDGTGSKYFRLNNMLVTDAPKYNDKGREYKIRNDCESYVNGIDECLDKSKPFIRIGDHSHTTNMIEYYDGDGKFRTDSSDQQDIINYLDSQKHPVGISKGDNGANTTDYGIQDYWTFIPAQPAQVADIHETITIISGNAFNLTGQVFYDNGNKPNGTYNSMTDSDTLLSGVTLNLYKETTDKSISPGKEYYEVVEDNSTANPSDVLKPPRNIIRETESLQAGKKYYELYDTGITPVAGRFYFTNISYQDGDTFVYEVIRPDSSYYLTSGDTKPTIHKTGDSENGSYALYAYDADGYGREVQIITVGSPGIDPTKGKSDNENNNTITAVDVGYHYKTYEKLKLKKTWPSDTSNLPDTAVFEVCYVDSTGTSHVYEENALSRINNDEYTYELLSSTENGAEVIDWYVAAEYYILGDNLYKHSFEYTPSEGTYKSFVGTSQYKALTDLNNDNVIDQADIPDGNEDKVSDWSDLQYITDWQSADGSAGDVKAPYHAVLDRNPGTQEITINITNAEQPGVIEILKYTGALEDNNLLQGATFRLYKKLDKEQDITIDMVQKHIIDNKPEDLQWLTDHQVASNTTRANGRVAFSGLNPAEHYVLREVFAPSGYRAMDSLFMIHPQSCNCPDMESLRNGERPAEKTDVEWEQYQRQNFWFNQQGTADYVQTAIANIPANGDMAIRKVIDGRAWNDNDSFTFDLSFLDSNNKIIEATTISEISDASSFFTLNDSVYSTGTDTTTLINALKGFVKYYNDNSADITINNRSDNAKNIISINGSQDIEEVLADTKQSVPLIINDDPVLDETNKPIPGSKEHPDDAKLNASTDGLNGESKNAPVPKENSPAFPAAGTYTFVISENTITGENASTLTKSPRVFTLVVDVIRKLDPNVPDGTPASDTNSYLHADVTQIYYQDPNPETANPVYPDNYSAKKVFADVSPTFTNTYQVLPAVQTSSYKITKEFTGRTDTNGAPLNSSDNTSEESTKYNDGWLNTDSFYVSLTGMDAETQTALDEGKLYIGGLHGSVTNPAARKWLKFDSQDVENALETDDSITGNIVDTGHTFNFDEIDFKNISFPVEWVFSDKDKLPSGKSLGEVVPKSQDNNIDVVIYIDETKATELGLEGEGNYFVPDATKIDSGTCYPVISRTQDVVYNVKIEEYVPASTDTKGITYDTKLYKLTITLKNAVQPDPKNPSEAVTDGIIDELDLTLYEIISKEEKIVATCETDQEVVTNFNDWAEAKFDDDEYTGDEDSEIEWTRKWYYINNNDGIGVIREAIPVAWSDGVEGSGTPIEFKVMVPDGKGSETDIHIVADDSAIQGRENYFTFDSLKSRPDTDLTFIAKREGHTGNHTMTFANTYSTTATWSPTVTKTLKGRDWQKDESFVFDIKATGWPGKETEYSKEPVFNDESAISDVHSVTITQDNGKDGTTYSAELPSVTFSSPGIYTFTISETNENGGGTKTEYGSINIKVVATDNDEGKLNLEISANDIEGESVKPGVFSNSGNATTINFINTYDEKGSFNLYLSKLLTGRDWIHSDSFTFTIEPDDNAIKDIDAGTLEIPPAWVEKSAKNTYTVTVPKSTSGKEDSATGWVTETISLGALNVNNLRTLGATYTFTIKEDTSNFAENHLYCAQPQIELTLQVRSKTGTENEGLTGALEFVATYAYISDGAIQGDSDHSVEDITLPFKNQYYSSPASNASDTLTIGKTLTGRDWLTDEQYTTTVKLTSGSQEQIQYKEGKGDSGFAPLTGSLSHTFDGEDSTGPDPWTLQFRFFETGIYVFEVTEEKPESPKANVISDTTTYKVTFTVEKDPSQNNKLVVTRSISSEPMDPPVEKPDGRTEDIVFVNRYEPKPATWTPIVTKVLNGRNWVGNDSFNFELALSESSDAKDGFTLPTPNPITITGADTDAGHTKSFGGVTFNRPGTYKFTITEDLPDNLGIQNNPEAGITFDIIVTDDPSKGQLLLTATVEGGTTSVPASETAESKVTFVNAYSESGTFDLSLTKLLTGRNWETEDSFVFTVEPNDPAQTAIKNGHLTVPTEWKTTDDSNTYRFSVTDAEEEVMDDGSTWTTRNLNLGLLTAKDLNADGATYKFTFREDMDGFEKSNLYCAQPQMTLTLTVQSSKDAAGLPTGTLEFLATYAYLGDSASHGSSTTPVTKLTLPFTNHFFAEPAPDDSGSSSVTIGKELTGRDWVDNEKYTVELKLKGGTGKAENVLYETADGYKPLADDTTIQHTFDDKNHRPWTQNFRFFEAGTYIFEAKELEPAQTDRKNGVALDETKYTITFEVTQDDTDGHLKVSRKITATPEPTKEHTVTADIVFVNDYTPEPAILDTTYAIQVEFDGRLGTDGNPINNDSPITRSWLPEDSFTVNVEGIGEATIEALKNRQLYIKGLHETLTDPDWDGTLRFLRSEVRRGEDGTKDVSVRTIENTDPKHIFPFEELDFRDIDFPTEGPDKGKVVYTLKITQVQGVNPGITYDESKYLMTITLVNDNPGDGIIDRMDLELRKDGTTEPLATCHTEQTVADSFEKWTETHTITAGEAPKNDVWDQYYVNKDGIVRRVTTEGTGAEKKFFVTVPDSTGAEKTYEIVDGPVTGDDQITFDALKADGVVFILRHETHTGDHVMTFKNHYEATGTWTPTIVKNLQGREWQENESFDFELTNTSWPGKDNSNGDTYKALTDSDTLTLSKENPQGSLQEITFLCPGTYVFPLTELNSNGGGTNVNDYEGLKLKVEAKDNDEGKLNLTVTAEDSKITPEINSSTVSDTIAPTITFVNTYQDSGKFPLILSKRLTGRTWNADEAFTFTIEANDTAKAAIAANQLTVPPDWTGTAPDGPWTISVKSTDPGTTDPDGWTTKQLDLGTIEVQNLRAGNAKYSFTIRENTEDFEGKGLETAQAAITVEIAVKPKRSATDGSLTGELTCRATYAYLNDAGGPAPQPSTGTATGDPTLVLPFVNRFWATPGDGTTEATLTIGKALEGRTWLGGESYAVDITLTDGPAEQVQYQCHSVNSSQRSKTCGIEVRCSLLMTIRKRARSGQNLKSGNFQNNSRFSNSSRMYGTSREGQGISVIFILQNMN